MITYLSENIKVPQFSRRLVSKWIKSVASDFNKRVGDIAYIFCNDEKILEVNNQYLSHNFYTDIITFDYSDNKTISGDIFISLDTVSSNASEFETDFKNELYRVIIHGILHLCGIKDKTDEEQTGMTKYEDYYLKLFLSDFL
jgi:rRNA maturation RNase YbeY